MVSPIQNSQQLVPGFINTNVIKIQGGREVANNYPIQINYTALLLDEENKTFFLKTRDQNGVLQPLREFKYEEVTPQENKSSDNDYVTREDFNKLLAEVKKLQKHSRDHKRNYGNKPYNKQ